MTSPHPPRPQRAPTGLLITVTAAGILAFGWGLLIGYAYGTHDAFFGETNSPATQFFGRSAFAVGCLGLSAGPAISWWFSRRSSTLAFALAPLAIALWLAAT